MEPSAVLSSKEVFMLEMLSDEFPSREVMFSISNEPFESWWDNAHTDPVTMAGQHAIMIETPDIAAGDYYRYCEYLGDSGASELKLSIARAVEDFDNSGVQK